MNTDGERAAPRTCRLCTFSASALRPVASPYLSTHHAAGLVCADRQLHPAAVYGSLPARVQSTSGKVRAAYALPASSTAGTGSAATPSVMPSHRAQPSCPCRPARQDASSRPKWARPELALSRRPPCHRTMYHAVVPASHYGAQIVLRASRIALASTTHPCKPYTHAPPSRPAPSRPAPCIPGRRPRIVHPEPSHPMLCQCCVASFAMSVGWVLPLPHAGSCGGWCCVCRCGVVQF